MHTRHMVVAGAKWEIISHVSETSNTRGAFEVHEHFVPATGETKAPLPQRGTCNCKTINVVNFAMFNNDVSHNPLVVSESLGTI